MSGGSNSSIKASIYLEFVNIDIISSKSSRRRVKIVGLPIFTQSRFMTAMFKLGICHFFLCFYIPMAIPDSMQKELKNLPERIF